MHLQTTPSFFAASTRTIAVFEAAKGILVLLAGFGLLSLLHHDVARFAMGLVRHLHLSPSGHYSRIFLKAAANLNDERLRLLAGVALLYASGRLIEAYGLWRERAWAKWLALVTGAIYLPVEIYELIERVTPARLTIFAVNILIVAFLAYERLYTAGLNRSPEGELARPVD